MSAIPRISLKFPAASLLFIFLLGSLSAEDPPSAGEVSVSATRISETQDQSPPNVSIIDRAEFQNRGISTLADALETAAGLAIRDNGPNGAQKTVSLRGSTSSQVLVLVDGVRINEAMSGFANLAGLSLENVERIEVIRSGSSAAYGGDALGGVINIITATKPSPLVVKVENGSYFPTRRVSGFGFAKQNEEADWLDLLDSQSISLSAIPKLGDALLSFSARGERDANSFSYTDSNQETRRRQNAGLLGANGSLGLFLPMKDSRLKIDSAGSWQRIGVPGSISAPTLNASQTDAQLRLSGSFESQRFFSDQLNLKAIVSAAYRSLDYRDGDTPANNGDHRTFSAEAGLNQEAFLSDEVTLAYGLTGSYAQATSSSLGQRTRWSAGAYFEPGFDIGDVSVRPAIRYDYYSDFTANDPLGSLAGTLGASWKLDGAQHLKLNLSRSYRVPSFEDLYWPSGNGVAGNPGLKPESGYELDIGYIYDDKTVRYSASAYARYSRDVIIWQAGNDGVWRPSNFGAALYPGIEQELAVHFAEWFSATVNYSFLYSWLLDNGLDLASDKRLPQTPVHTLSATLGFARDGFSWSATIKYESLRFLTVANTTSLPAHFALDLASRLVLSANAALSLAITNLFSEHYQIVNDYPMPPAQLRIGFELTL